MGYLVCERCGGCYELKPGESPEDFEKCECGGTLHFVEKLDQNVENPVKNRNKDNSTDSKTKSSKKIIITGLTFGTLIMLIPYIIFSGSLYVFGNWLALVLWVIAGFITAYITNGKLKSGIVNGFLIAVLSGVVFLIVSIILSNDMFVGLGSDLVYDFGFLIGRFILCMLIPAVFSIIGGVLGVFIHSKWKKTQPKIRNTHEGD